MRIRKGTARRSTQMPRRRWYGIIGLGTILLFLYVSEQVAVVVLEQRINMVTAETSVLATQIDNMKMRHSELRKGARIKQIAIDNLGLQLPERIPGVLF